MSETNNQRLIQEFYTCFQVSKTGASSHLTSRLEKLKDQGDVSNNDLNGLTLDITGLRKSLTDATVYLNIPSYDLRLYEEALKSLEQSLDEIRTSFAPKPKFSFKRSKPATTPSSVISPSPAPSGTSSGPHPVSPPEGSTNRLLLFNQSKKYLDWTSLPSNSSSDLTVSNLDHCIVNLVGGTEEPTQSITALHVQNLQDCVLILPPSIDGSALLHDLKRCTIILGCHQFRMHSSTSVNVYLSISSNPIIEHCSAVAFAAYPPELSKSAIPVADSKHLSVQDFTHIRATPSPNWKALPSSETISAEDWGMISTIRGPIGGDRLEEVLAKLLPKS
ncbi:tubulin binding cofactor C-domain-containing protein [Abortiporus biennis]|nr:tubulin binding cofactor C-domain-containing protein [Abortiporus biennis]